MSGVMAMAGEFLQSFGCNDPPGPHSRLWPADTRTKRRAKFPSRGFFGSVLADQSILPAVAAAVAHIASDTLLEARDPALRLIDFLAVEAAAVTSIAAQAALDVASIFLA